MRCNYCKGVGHLIQNCAILKEKEHRLWTNQHAQPHRNQHGPRHEKDGGGQARQGGDGEQKWCSFHNSTSDSGEKCRIQLSNKTNNGSANCATYPFYLAVLSPRGPPPACVPERPCISSTAAEAPTRAAPMEEEGSWSFGPMDEPVASFDTSGLFGAFGGVTGEETSGSAFMLEEGHIEGSGLLKRITGGWWL